MNDMNYDYEFFEFLGIRINNNDEKLKSLLKDENVRKILKLLVENKRVGKCKPKKSAAELWYEMEERCDERAIATLNKILEEKQGKTK